MRLSAFTHDTLLLFAGPIVWALHFLAIYGLTGIACARPVGAAVVLGLGWEGWAVLACTVLAALVLAASLLARSRSDDAHNRAFVRWTSLALSALALLGIAWETLAVFMVPGCTPQG